MKPSINHEFLTGKKSEKIDAEIIKHSNESWILISKIEDLESYKKVLSQVDTRDLSQYTSAKGKNSKQYYLENPEWNPFPDFEEPDGWKSICNDLTLSVQRLLISHSLMPIDWKHLIPSGAWTVIGDEGSFHTIHDHGCEKISTILYIETPVYDKEISCYKPGFPYFVVHGQPFSNISPPARRIVELEPFAGMLIVFPSWILHGVYPQGPGIRQTLNIDFKGN